MKTTKNYTSFLAIGMIAMFSAAMVSCGGEDDEPQPNVPVEKTDLEIVQEGILGSWTFQSATVTMPDGEVVEYVSGDCEMSKAKNFAVDVDYVFLDTTQYLVSKNKALYFGNNCHTEIYANKREDNQGYSVNEKDGVFTVSIYSATELGVTYTILTTPEEIDGDIVTVSASMNGSTRIVKYKKN